MGNIEMVESAAAAGFRIVKPSLEGVKASCLVVQGSRWCCWRAELSGRPKPAKVPYGANGKRLNISKIEGWLPFDDACSTYANSGGFDGIGVRMGSLDCVVGLDLDGCLGADGNPTESQSQVVADFLAIGGYIEVSPSGTGLRQFVRGSRLKEYREKTGPLEIYDSGSSRYLTLTGIPYPIGSAAGNVVEAQEMLEAFIVKYLDRVPDVQPMDLVSAKSGSNARSTGEVLALLRRYNKRGVVTRLLNGNMIDHDGDHSKADLALCCEVAFFCRDPQVIDAILRQSLLMREKWDEKRGKETYGNRTIREALERQTRSFDEDRAEKSAVEAEAVKVSAKSDELLKGGAADLRGAKGRFRTDAWALTELLMRDRRLLGVLYYDEFANMPMVSRSLSEALNDKCAPSEVGRLIDDHVSAFARWMGREWLLSLKPDQVRAAVLGLAQAVRFNPVQRRLDELGCSWDNKPRLDDWLVQYMKAAPVVGGGNILPYLQAVGARWLISVVARGYQPGCKADDMLILEGAQGARKSSAVRALAEVITPECFREGFSLGMGKDDQIALRGRLVVEWAELSGLNRHDRNTLKNFLTLRTDSYRQAYAAFERDWPRTAIFCGTTNDSSYLSDSTGNRRFLPVTVGKIDIDALRRDAAQIIGEAVVRYKSGAKWWLDDDCPADGLILALARREQAGRVGATFWSEIANGLAERLVRGELYRATGGDIVEAFPVEAFDVPQMRVWLSTSSGALAGQGVAGSGNRGGNGNEAEIMISDANWIRVVEGLRLAGWESHKRTGRMVWGLSPEKRDELCMLYGRGIGPTVSEVRKARRGALAGAG